MAKWSSVILDSLVLITAAAIVCSWYYSEGKVIHACVKIIVLDCIYQANIFGISDEMSTYTLC
jgi:hypothetical protein